MSMNMANFYGPMVPQTKIGPFLNLGTTVANIPKPVIVVPSVFVQIVDPVQIGLTGSTPATFAPFLPNLTKSSAASKAKANNEVAQDDNTAKASTGKVSYNAEQLYSRWHKESKTITPEFCQKVVEVAKRINCNPEDLMAIMKSESNFNPKCTNKKGSAAGLFQFLDCTFEDLSKYCPELKGLTRSKFLNMSAIQQLDVAEKFFKRAKQIAKIPADQKLDAGTLYALDYMPARANREVLAVAGEKYYEWNKAFDKNKDGKITKSELITHLRSKRPNNIA